MRALNLKQPVPPEDFQKAAPALRPSFIRFMESKNILIEGLHIMGSSMWTVHILYSQNVTIRDLIIETFPGANTDGMDIDSSQDVRISNCYLDTGDDAICLKSGKDADGLRVNRPTANIAITNCTVHRGHGAVVLGSETSGGFHNIVASNIVCQGTQKGVRIKSTRGRGGLIENVRFDHWTMDNVDEAINVTNYYTSGPEEPVSERTPIFRNIAISNMTINHSPLMINIEGLTGDAGGRIADQQHHRDRQGRHAGIQHEGDGVAQRAGQSGSRPGIPDSRFQGTGTRSYLHTQAGCRSPRWSVSTAVPTPSCGTAGPSPAPAHSWQWDRAN